MNDEMTDANSTDSESGPTEEIDFRSVASRLNDDLSAATMRLVQATQGFTSLIQSFVIAGEALERSISIHRELGAASQRAVEEAREAARAAGASASESESARDASKSVLELTTEHYGTVSDLVEDLRQRIAALSILAAPMPRPQPRKASQPEPSAEAEEPSQVDESPTEGSAPSEPYEARNDGGQEPAEAPAQDSNVDEEWKRRLAAEVEGLSG